MKKRVICLLLCALILLCGCKKSGSPVGADKNGLLRMESIAELQKSLFTAKIISAETKNALITKYNFGITRYTVYRAEIISSVDGYTPKGEVELYRAGADGEFSPRFDIKRGESYIFDAQPWVYGDKTVYLLGLFTAAYPRIDAGGGVTLESEDGLLDCGTLESYLSLYDQAKTELVKKTPDFFSPQKTLERFGVIAAEIRDKNCDKSVYTDKSRGYEWVPDDDFCELTAKTSEKLYADFSAISPDGMDESALYAALRELLS